MSRVFGGRKERLQLKEKNGEILPQQMAQRGFA